MSLIFDGNAVAHTPGGRLVPLPNYPTPTTGAVIVNHRKPLGTNAAKVGINLNYWEDADSRRTQSHAPLRNGLGLLRPKFARWPGGHKADGVTWFLDAAGNTTVQPNPRLCRFGAGEWPATAESYWTPTNDPNGSFARDIYGLQAFLEDCRHTGAEPVIVAPLDAGHNPASVYSPTKAQLIANAERMVAWCNVENNYGVKYWALGNESWSDSTGYTRGYPGDPTAYGTDFGAMAVAMKAIDPTILLGLNGNQQAWFETAIAAAGPANVDWLDAHRYPFFGTDYTAYQAVGVPNMVSEANRASNAIATLAEPHRSRIFVMMGETGFNSQPNNMGAGVVLAHILGEQIAAPNIAGIMSWNSRYAPLGTSHDALNEANGLTPTGLAQSLVTRLAPGEMVATTSTRPNVYGYASRDDRRGRTAVLLVSRSNATETLTVGVAGVASGRQHQLAGTGYADTAPTITKTAANIVAGGVSVTLPPASVTLLMLSRFA